MKQPRLKLYTIDMKYVRDLAKVDGNVMSISPQINKSSRPFVGILVLLNEKSYCIPLTSPKAKFEKKKNTVDFIKILHNTKKDENGAYKVIGALNLNNMIPVKSSLLTPIDLNIHQSDNGSTRTYKQLMKDQLDWCQANQDIILKRANQLYNLVCKYPEQNRNLTKRCCDFKKLEKVLDKYLGKKTHDIEMEGKSVISRQNRGRNPFSPKQINKNAAKISEKHDRSRSADKSKGRNNPDR